MTALTLPEVAGTQLVGFLLVLSRVGGIFMFAPVFSSKLIPVKAKIVAAGAISLPLAPLAVGDGRLPTDPVVLAGLMTKEIIVGLAFALTIAVIAAAVQSAASLLDTIVGFSFASVVDPFFGQNNAVIGQLYSAFTVVVFLLLGGDHMVVGGLAASYELLPLDAVPSVSALGELARDNLARVFVIGLEIAAPVVLALVVVDAALGLVARAAPQMNVFVVGLPAKILVGLAVIGASLPFVANHIHGELEGLVRAGLGAFRIQ